jgi:hypothetical protein
LTGRCTKPERRGGLPEGCSMMRHSTARSVRAATPLTASPGPILILSPTVRFYADVSGYAVVSRAVLHRQLSEGLGAVSWGSRPHGPARAMEPFYFFLQHDLRGVRVSSRAGVSSVQPRGGVLGMRLHCNGHRPLSITHRDDGSCDVRTEEPLLSCSWVRRSVADVVTLVSDVADTTARSDAESYEKQARLLSALELSWDIETPRWLLSFNTTDDASMSFIAFSMDMPTVPAMLCIASGERCEAEAETVYFSHLAGQIPRQGQV